MLVLFFNFLMFVLSFCITMIFTRTFRLFGILYKKLTIRSLIHIIIPRGKRGSPLHLILATAGPLYIVCLLSYLVNYKTPAELVCLLFAY